MLIRCPGAADEALSYCKKLVPCVWIVDRELREKADPVQFANTVDFGRAIQVLVLVSREEPPAVLERLLRIGCMGFIREGDTASSLRQAVRAIASGEFWASRKLISRLLQEHLAATDPGVLTKRETEILGLIAMGYKNREIAEKLFISRQTVRWHVRSLYTKIGVQDRLGAVFHRMEQIRKEEPGAPGAAKKPPAQERLIQAIQSSAVE